MTENKEDSCVYHSGFESPHTLTWTCCGKTFRNTNAETEHCQVIHGCVSGYHIPDINVSTLNTHLNIYKKLCDEYCDEYCDEDNDDNNNEDNDEESKVESKGESIGESKRESKGEYTQIRSVSI